MTKKKPEPTKPGNLAKPKPSTHQVNTRQKCGARKIHINIRTVERLASQGLSKQQICDALGISDETLRRRELEDVEIVAAIARGKAAGIKRVTNALFQKAIKGNVPAQVFYLKNQAGWRDKIDVELEQNIPQPLVILLPPDAPVIDVQPELPPEPDTRKAG